MHSCIFQVELLNSLAQAQERTKDETVHFPIFRFAGSWTQRHTSFCLLLSLSLYRNEAKEEGHYTSQAIRLARIYPYYIHGNDYPPGHQPAGSCHNSKDFSRHHQKLFTPHLLGTPASTHPQTPPHTAPKRQCNAPSRSTKKSIPGG